MTLNRLFSAVHTLPWGRVPKAGEGVINFYSTLTRLRNVRRSLTNGNDLSFREVGVNSIKKKKRCAYGAPQEFTLVIYFISFSDYTSSTTNPHHSWCIAFTIISARENCISSIPSSIYTAIYKIYISSAVRIKNAIFT